MKEKKSNHSTTYKSLKHDSILWISQLKQQQEQEQQEQQQEEQEEQEQQQQQQQQQQRQQQGQQKQQQQQNFTFLHVYLIYTQQTSKIYIISETAANVKNTQWKLYTLEFEMTANF